MRVVIINTYKHIYILVPLPTGGLCSQNHKTQRDGTMRCHTRYTTTQLFFLHLLLLLSFLLLMLLNNFSFSLLLVVVVVEAMFLLHLSV